MRLLKATKPIEELRVLGQEHLQEFFEDGVQLVKFFGTYALFIDGFNWMNTNDIDLKDHSCILSFTGSVLITGLGLGLAAKYALSVPEISRIVVIENDPRVIQHVLPLIEPFNSSQKLEVICADADTWTSEERFDYCFLDHHKAAIPEEIISRFRAISTETICWFEEVQKWL